MWICVSSFILPLHYIRASLTKFGSFVHFLEGGDISCTREELLLGLDYTIAFLQSIIRPRRALASMTAIALFLLSPLLCLYVEDLALVELLIIPSHDYIHKRQYENKLKLDGPPLFFISGRTYHLKLAALLAIFFRNHVKSNSRHWILTENLHQPVIFLKKKPFTAFKVIKIVFLRLNRR